MRVEMAHLHDRGINVAVLAADACTHARNDRRALLNHYIRAGQQASGRRLLVFPFTESGPGSVPS